MIIVIKRAKKFLRNLLHDVLLTRKMIKITKERKRAKSTSGLSRKFKQTVIYHDEMSKVFPQKCICGTIFKIFIKERSFSWKFIAKNTKDIKSYQT